MEQISLGHRYKECRPRRNSSCPTKILVGKDLLKELEHRGSSPSVIAKLMGIDVLPPAYITNNRHQEFKDVFEVSKEPQEAITKERSHHFPKGLPSLKRSALKFKKLMPSKSPYGDEIFDNNVAHRDGLDRLNSLEINNPLFEKRPHDVNYSAKHQYEKDTASTFRKYPVGLGNTSLKDIRNSSRGNHGDFNSIVVLEPGLGKVQDSGKAFSTPDPSHINKNFRREMKHTEFSMLNRERVSPNLLETEDVNMSRIKGERYLTSNAVDSLLKGQESSFDHYNTLDTSSTGSSQKTVSGEVNSRQSNRPSSNSSPRKNRQKYEEGSVGSKTLAEMFALSDSERLKRDLDSHAQIQHNKVNQGNSNGKEGCFIVLPKHAPRLHPHSSLDKNSPHSKLNTSITYNNGQFHLDSFWDVPRLQQMGSPSQDNLRNASCAKHQTFEQHRSASSSHDNRSHSQCLTDNFSTFDCINEKILFTTDEDLVRKPAETVHSSFGSRLSREEKVSASPFDSHNYESITISDHTYVAKSRKSLKEVEQPSPVSILEPPTDEDSCCSGYFKSDLQDMPNVEKLIDDSELRYEQELSLSSDDDNGNSYLSLEAFQIEEERDFSYLLDILISSGMIVADSQLLCKSWHSPGCPVGPHVFDRLERKYNKISTWPRPERRLLFDLANSVLSEILAPWKSSRRCCPVWGPEGPVEVVWQTMVRQQEELAVGHPDDKVLDPEWLEVGEDINMVGKQIAKMLHGDLLDEVILEFLSGYVAS
ncbi:hypothetical protein E2562_030060 [Oryza meyeriana var. granulata]|uniref:DUF4378 domain-containing protein n=1 Tax=Oryza meyeriana var. granulata TaxID=110450 RepID=A0A6G1CTY4_9ORYZ|nr:hypothetical protein E2562_030060 [Oryza meyeriana var. granulata]KAF0903915.1 hypothetical protein E2562_030060 [Oryza meyeriana var. granulata]KAF0903916.1 hypothetical protein E2562_030060 [Oryza meyeriana var. granulata]KAF0903917.1 hypothetical protein E2562_030060 [Oryza meyeriana var. granulata]KAF0903918.1 hypothetical protein E2562_030060 [Oryza meyeriana var. granulata]